MIQPHIVIVGSLNADLVVEAPIIPRAGQTVLAGDLHRHAGGKGGNQAVATSRLGARCSMIARVGADALGDELREGLRDAGVNVERVLLTPSVPTGAALIVVDPSGQNAICVAPGANARLTPDDVRAADALIRSADALIVQWEVPLETTCAALAMASEAGVRTIVDPAPAAASPPSGALHATVVSPNQSEAETLTGVAVRTVDDAVAAARRLRERTAAIIVMKLGELGSLWVDAEGPVHAAAMPVGVVDSTAAGDAFTAALAVAVVRGDAPAMALRFANAAGAMACTRRGAQGSLPTLAEVTQWLKGE